MIKAEIRCGNREVNVLTGRVVEGDGEVSPLPERHQKSAPLSVNGSIWTALTRLPAWGWSSSWCGSPLIEIASTPLFSKSIL